MSLVKTTQSQFPKCIFNLKVSFSLKIYGYFCLCHSEISQGLNSHVVRSFSILSLNYKLGSSYNFTVSVYSINYISLSVTRCCTFTQYCEEWVCGSTLHCIPSIIQQKSPFWELPLPGNVAEVNETKNIIVPPNSEETFPLWHKWVCGLTSLSFFIFL